jgi:hypothetical protein
LGTALLPESVSAVPQRLDQRLSTLDIQLSSQVRYMSFDHVGMVLPIEIVQMFQQLLL